MTSQPAPNPEADPTLAVAERQLVLLGELVEIVMAAARASGSASQAASQAEKMILAEDCFTPEVGRARACGAKDAAESLQKVARAARLTMKLQMVVAEIVRDIRAGVVTHSHAGEDPGSEAGAGSGAPAERPEFLRRSAGVLAGSGSDNRDPDVYRLETNTERLVEFDRAETLPHAPFRETVDEICTDAGAAVDWTHWTIGAPIPKPAAVSPEPLNFPVLPWSLNHLAATEPEAALPP